MSRGWQANIPGFIFYGIIFGLIPAVYFIKKLVGGLQDNDRVEAIIAFMADNTPCLYDTFSELNFAGNFLIALFALNLFLCMLILIGFQMCNWFMNSAAKNSSKVGFSMYFPILFASIILFIISLVMAVYFYPNI